ncbi:MAG: hypothetical protein AABZ80_03655 [Gemmatimonadota bacterium]
MPVTIPSAAMRQMSESERERLLDSAFAWSPEALSNYLALIDARLREYERRYELPSSELGEALAHGLRETADVSAWLFWAHVRADLAGARV